MKIFHNVSIMLLCTKGDIFMTKYFSDRKNMSSLSTVFVFLLVMVAVMHYYLQYDNSAVYWTLTIGYFVLLLESVSALIFGKLSKDFDVLTVGLGFTFLSAVMLIGEILGIIGNSVSSYFILAGQTLPLIFITAKADRVISKKPLLKKWWYVVPVAVALIGIFVWSTFTIIIPNDLAHNILYVLCALLAVFGLVLGIIGIAKKKSEFFSWSVTLYSFMTLVMFVLKLFEKFTLANKFASVQNALAALMIIALYSVEVQAKKRK